MDKTRNRYTGTINPSNFSRDGFGSYNFDNKYFKYEGEYLNGKKHGQGTLKLGQDQHYEGEFQNGEITGEGVMKWTNGKIYKGQFQNGEKHGFGKFKEHSSVYEGEFSLNQRHGQGKLVLSDGTKFEGLFQNNKPNGQCLISYQNGNTYQGQCKDGNLEGQGIFNDYQNNITYDGNWLNNQYSGQGSFKQNQYNYEGQFNQGNPQVLPNMISVSKVAIKFEEGQLKQIPKVQFDPIDYVVGSQPFSVFFYMSYQAPDCLDPVQLSEEEIQELITKFQKDNAKNKNPPQMPDFRAPKMMTPHPVQITQESGRNFQLSMVLLNTENNEEKPFRYDMRQYCQYLRQKKLDQEQNQEVQEEVKRSRRKSAQNSEIDLEEKEEVYEGNDENNEFYTENGAFCLENLEFPENYPLGKYILRIIDVTDINFVQKLQPIEVEIIIRSTVVEKEDPKKKKK